MSGVRGLVLALTLISAGAGCGGKTTDSASPSDGGVVGDGSLGSDDGTLDDASFADASDLGSYDWAWQTTTPKGSEGGSEDARVAALAIDSTGGAVVVGTLSKTTRFGGETYVGGENVINGLGFVASLDVLGHLRWSRAFRGSYGPDAARAVAIDAHDRVHVAGVFGNTVVCDEGSPPLLGGSSSPEHDTFICTYEAGGAYVRSIHLAASGSSHTVDVDALAVSGSTLFAAGEMLGTLDLGAGPLTPPSGQPGEFLAAYDDAGALRWNRLFVGLGYRSITAMAARPGGGVVLLGSASGRVDLGFGASDGGDEDVWVAAFDDAGKGVWMRRFGTFARGAQLPTLAVAPDGTVTFYLVADASVDFGRGKLPVGPVLVDLDTTGATVAARALALVDDQDGALLARSPRGDAWLAVTHLDRVSVPDEFPLHVGLLARLRDPIATTPIRAATNKNVDLRALAFDSTGHLYLAGFFGGLSGPFTDSVLQLGSTALGSPGYTTSIFVARATVR